MAQLLLSQIHPTRSPPVVLLHPQVVDLPPPAPGAPPLHRCHLWHQHPFHPIASLAPSAGSWRSNERVSTWGLVDRLCRAGEPRQPLEAGGVGHTRADVADFDAWDHA